MMAAAQLQATGAGSSVLPWPAAASDGGPPDGSQGAHRFLMQRGGGTCTAGSDDEQRAAAYAFIRGSGGGAHSTAMLIAGAWQRTLDANHRAFSVTTEHTVRAVTLQAASHFADLRVPCDPQHVAVRTAVFLLQPGT
jgi:hypothetical protein